MKRKLLFALLPLTVLLFFAAFAVAPARGEGTEALVWTDRPNYAPGKTVNIYGSGFNPSVKVTISIATPHEEVDQLYADTDDAGNFASQYQLGGTTGTYTVTATDGEHTSNTASFTVSEPFYISIDTINGFSPPFPILGNPVHLVGSASATDFPSELTDYSVQVDWGDGTRFSDTSQVDFVQSGQDFSGTWSSYPDHTYATSGEWSITVKLYHGTPPGLAPGDAEAHARPQVEVGGIQIGITIDTTTSPTGLNLVVDSVQYTAPWTFEWIVGSTHSIGTTSPQLVSAGMRYSWTRWSDDGAITHDIIVPSTSTTYTAYFTAQYYLTVDSSHGTASGEGWYDDTSFAYASLTDGTMPDGTGVQYVFTGWSGDASGTGLTSDPIAMDRPKTATANWKTRYYLTVDSAYDTPTPMSGWFDADTKITASVASPWSQGVTDTRYICTGWTGTGSVPTTGMDTSVTFTVNEPSSITWNWITQFYLTIATSPSDITTPSGAGWYDQNTYASISTAQYVDITVGSSRYRFSGWTTDDTSEIVDSSLTSTTLMMDKGKIVTANYVEQFKLTIATEPAEVSVSRISASPSSVDGFYDMNTEVRLKAETPVAIDTGSQWRFDHWSQDASGNSPSSSVIMDGKKSVTANYVKQFKVKLDQTGVGSDYSGVIITLDGTDHDFSALPQSFWLDEGDHSFEFYTPLTISDEKQYRWEDTSGITAERSGTLSISHSGNLIGNYKTQYYLDLETSPSGVTTPIGAEWYDVGTYASVSTVQYVDSGTDASSYYSFSGWTTTDMTEIADPSATSTAVLMDKAKTVTANYEIHYLIQYYLTLETDPTGIYSPSGSGWYYKDNPASISTAEYIDIVPGSSRYRFIGWITTDITEINDPSAASTTVLVDRSKTVTAKYVLQYAITFDQTGLDSSATGTVITVDSITKTFTDLPYTVWVDFGNTLVYSYSNPVISSMPSEQFWLKIVSGLPSPFTVDKAYTIVGNYLALPLSVITDCCLCYFDEDGQTPGQQFTLIFLQISANTYMLVVSNPWQVYYNVFYVGKPGDLVDLTVTIPYPFVTRGCVPVNVYSYVSIDCYGRFRPSGKVTSEFAITGPSTTAWGAPGISLGDYTGSFGSNVNIEVTGVVPSSGLVYVMVSLDYGLEWTWEYGMDSDGNAIDLHTNELLIENGQSYIFSYKVDDLTYTQIIQSENVFIRFPWLIRIFAHS